MKYNRKKEYLEELLAMFHLKSGNLDKAINKINRKLKPRAIFERDWKKMTSQNESEKYPVSHEVIEKKKETFETCKKQHVFWDLRHPPLNKDFMLINSFFYCVSAKIMEERNKSIYYRIFNHENSTSIHIRIVKKDWGFSIYVHRDLFKHQGSIFDKECLAILSRLYIFLKGKYGRVFLLPREKIKFHSFLGHKFVRLKRK